LILRIGTPTSGIVLPILHMVYLVAHNMGKARAIEVRIVRIGKEIHDG
jgi:hypothetical protein